MLNRIAPLLILMWLLVVALSITRTPNLDDFKWYWQGARSQLSAGDAYVLRRDPAQLSPREVLYSYPPPFASLLQPLALLDYRTSPGSG